MLYANPRTIGFMADTSSPIPRSPVRLTAAAAVSAAELRQLASGHAAAYRGSYSIAVDNPVSFHLDGQYTVPKTAGIVLLDGGRAFWDRSARAITYRKNGDRDFEVGSIVGDAASADTTCVVNFGQFTRYDYDLINGPANSIIVGTPVLGTPSACGFGYPQRIGGSVLLELGAANEAQKVDLIGLDTLDVVNANPIIEFAFRRLDTPADSVQDFNIGLASGTHATDFDSITGYLALHIDGGTADNKLQSKDGTTTVAATDTTTDHTSSGELADLEVWWFDCRTPSSVAIYRNGVRVLSGTTFNIAAAASNWRLIVHLEKTAAANNRFRVLIDEMRARTAEQ